MVPTANKPAAGVPFYTPAQDPPAGTASDPDAAPTLFRQLRIRDVRLANRVVLSPMCQYSARDGHLTDYHLVHLGQFALSGAALTMVEASAVEPRGRISPEDSGIWAASHVAPLRRITDFVHSQNQKVGIQLAHGGRKASTLAPWLREGHAPAARVVAGEADGGWPDDVVAPSAIPYADDWPAPRELSVPEIEAIVEAFAAAARRAVEAGFDVVEIHAAHGYLLAEFLSPLTNRRTDRYGGSFENRIRLVVQVIQAVRAAVPAGMPVFLRISATEWMEHTGEPTWDLQQSIRLAQLLPGLGVDLLDVSSGGNSAAQKIDLHPYYQVELAGQIRAALRREGKQLLVGAVGMISSGKMARDIVQGSGDDETSAADEGDGHRPQADVVLVGRQFLREPNFVLKMAKELGVAVKWPNQYHRAPRVHG
ncbi:NADH:flavin oxidoreductase / NADH oxidase family protein [Hirsutella rhossiliensis]|uniref:NADH:flavin oxidoreductase / NADH oxidase family domain-containing protein n=1 Tax=Hirsutella rhossiliensis TaxID=111463 RepID=A0A9P8MM99_9HYPO|nr:NADH:flavin oxidoreductase / NADH oxidase family domain-containing protein [Hirsutella rhossiliensis]KAH0957592.1 NADH:flavin oxidoreductase / NADH oxidase family domain-containing protein [Hirsutella rhossiliensis]